MEPRLAIAEYAFKYLAIDKIVMPPFSEGIWHRIFGRSLREICCITPTISCEKCLLKNQCNYAFLFVGVRPPWAEMMRKYPTIPVPHIFKYRLNDVPQIISPGEEFKISLVLVGSANEQLPLVVRTLANAGKAGIGRERSCAELMEVEQNGPATAARTIFKNQKMESNHTAEIPKTTQMPARVRVQLITPYIPSGKSVSIDHFDFVRLIMAVVRRISMFQYFYMGSQLDANYKQLKETAKNVSITSNQLTPYKGSSYSTRQNKRFGLSGLKGFFDIDTGDMQNLWPYLYLGQWLNIGKWASMGFGRYELMQGI